MPAQPEVEAVRCVAKVPACSRPGTLLRGAVMRATGRGLQDARALKFLGRSGRRDDISVRLRHVDRAHFESRVSVRARRGPIVMITNSRAAVALPGPLRLLSAPSQAAPTDDPSDSFIFGGLRKPTLGFTATGAAPTRVELVREEIGQVVRVWAGPFVPGPNQISWDGMIGARAAPPGRYNLRMPGPEPAPAGSSYGFTLHDNLFPIRGRHDLGQTTTNGFGGGRGHQGQDMFAACGTSLVAARQGIVRYAGYHKAAGNYVVIQGKASGFDYVYMHMKGAPLVRAGDEVYTGQPIGRVGDTGNAQGCHLHFELWSQPGWYQGGRPIDPLPRLRQWDSYS